VPCRSYGTPFLVETYFHHVTRLDHRHNFSPYNTLLYLASATPASSSSSTDSSSFHAESLAFLPQLLLSCLLIPFVLAKKDLATSMMAQTFAFVTFNKVCTSQVRPFLPTLSPYFVLPLYASGSVLYPTQSC
jgi:phosphatidylinositol glycan class M